jgi:diguanylate cyclase (GGDEF)-like protein
MQLELVLPRLVDDARHAVHLLRHSERLDDERSYDELTGLANQRALDRALPRTSGGVVIRIDVDLGDDNDDASGGRSVLTTFARVLAAEARANHVSCRVGGPEFVVIAPETDVAAALELIGRLRAVWVEVRPDSVTFSAGVAAVSSTGGGAAALLSADRALHRAKGLGGNRTEIDAASAVVEPVGVAGALPR